MPLLRYFLFVGGSLLALLFIANAALPTVPLPATLRSASALPAIRIHSDRKLPERLVFDTSVSHPTQAPAAPVVIAQAQAQPTAQAAAAVPDADVSAKARVREAFAQLPLQEEASEPKMSQMATVVLPEPKMYAARPQPKPKVAAKPRPAHPPMMVAQQRRFGGFNFW